ncbi:MAG: hypothetical protein CBB72_005250 [Muricauda sp. TMED12]|nr:MAG: hypothetical protein CBB72_005250 [Muricauda sp. TMED12]
MKVSSLPYHLMIPGLISILILVFMVIHRRKLFKTGKWKWFWISAAVFFGVYLLIVGEAAYFDISYNQDLQKFDTNGDGFFTANEISPEQKEAMQKVVSDTGRNFAVFTGLIFSGVLALLVFTGGNILEFIKLKARKSKPNKF